MVLSAKDFPGSPGYVREMKWTPDGCAVAVAWSKGGISLWSTFGTMLMCSLGWDYGLHVDLSNKNPFDINCMDWSTEGYQLFMLRQQKIYPKDHSKTPNRSPENDATKHQKQVLTHSYSNASEKSDCSNEQYKIKSTLVQLDFVKSSFAVNPCMVIEIDLMLCQCSCKLNFRAPIRIYFYKETISSTLTKVIVCKRSTTIASTLMIHHSMRRTHKEICSHSLTISAPTLICQETMCQWLMKVRRKLYVAQTCLSMLCL